ncbi:MAG TPA: pilus assembly protein N-terminal domain-containing protein [Bryobacteraceae bacterium]|nr:pilus assembly protein N-terminal domain-containing protein [Bryobacteraceae bacterium]
MIPNPSKFLAPALACMLVSAQPGPILAPMLSGVPASNPVQAVSVPLANAYPALAEADGPAAATSFGVPLNGSHVLDQPAGIRRLSISNADIAEAIAVSSTEVVIHGKVPGDTTLIVWDQKGGRALFEVHVLPNPVKLDAIRGELLSEAGPDVSMNVQEGLVFLNGVVKDGIAADRAVNIVSSLGKVVNLLRVITPPAEPQILLKVRFADVDRSTANQMGVNLFSLNPKGVGSSTTGQFGAPPNLSDTGSALSATLTNLLNVFYFRPDINLGTMLQDLATKNVLQILAEPNLLTISGRPASFLAGGEFPFPTLQGGGAGVGQITIQFKEFGVRLNFLPTVTPRGTIRLNVNPEVSSLNYADGLTVSGFTIPALSSRKVQTEIELESGQSFVIAGLLNNQVTEQLSRMPGLSSIPLFGKLFNSRSASKSNSELLIMVTPEIVQPLEAGMKPPEIPMPLPFLKDAPMTAPRHPGSGAAAPLPAIYRRDTLPIEELRTTPQGPPSNDNSVPGYNGISPAQPLVFPLPGSAAPASQPSNPNH